MSSGHVPEGIDAGTRLRRLFAVLTYLAGVGESSIGDLAARFGFEPESLVGELELAACCGLPPYTPDTLLELIVDDDRVVAYGLEALRRPPRLTPDEGFTLAAAARAMLAIEGVEPTGPLATALDKLGHALGLERVSVELEVPPHLAELREVAAAGEAVEIDYLGAKRGAETTRRVEPYAVVAREGTFYLDAYCALAGDWRRFQVARITRVRRLGEPVTARSLPAALGGARAFVGGAGRAPPTSLSIRAPTCSSTGWSRRRRPVCPTAVSSRRSRSPTSTSSAASSCVSDRRPRWSTRLSSRVPPRGSHGGRSPGTRTVRREPVGRFRPRVPVAPEGRRGGRSRTSLRSYRPRRAQRGEGAPGP